MKMKKIIALFLIGLFILSSCGPRRYRCGPYRKCENTTKEIKPLKTNEKEFQQTENS